MSWSLTLKQRPQQPHFTETNTRCSVDAEKKKLPGITKQQCSGIESHIHTLNCFIQRCADSPQAEFFMFYIWEAAPHASPFVDLFIDDWLLKLSCLEDIVLSLNELNFKLQGQHNNGNMFSHSISPWSYGLHDIDTKTMSCTVL